jgi:hypothetical protein
MLANVTFYNDQELPTTDLIWTQPDGTSLYDFSSGWTFSLRLARVTAPATTLLLKTTGITGASTSPNLSIAWSTSDWSGLEASTNGTKYVGAVYARRTADSYDMAANISVTLKAAPGTSAVSPSSYPITVTAASVTLADTGDNLTATDEEAAWAEIFQTPSTTTRRVVELATNAEALAATDAVRAVTPANLSQFVNLTRYNGQRNLPTSALAQSIPRYNVNNQSTVSLVSGRQNFVLMWLPAGTISSISFISGTTAATTPTAQWFSIYDINRNKLAVTADDTSTAWAAQTLKSLTIAGGYTVATEGLYYIGIMVNAATPPTLGGASGYSTAVNALPPLGSGLDGTNTGLTTPATAPAIAAAFTSSGVIPYAYVS